MDGTDVAETAGVLGQYVRWEIGPGGRSDLQIQIVVDKPFRVCGKGCFREALSLDVEEPVPVFGGELFVGFLVHVICGDNIQQGTAFDLLRVVYNHPVQYPCAPVMTGHMETVIPQCLHHFNLVVCQSPLGIIGMVGQAFRLAAVTVAPQVSNHDGVMLRQFRSQEPPHQVRFRMPVNEQDSFFPAAADESVDYNTGFCFNPLLRESGKILFINRHSDSSSSCNNS